MDVDLGRGIRPPVMGGETHHPRLQDWPNNHFSTNENDVQTPWDPVGITVVPQAVLRLKLSSLGLQEISTFGKIVGGIAAVPTGMCGDVCDPSDLEKI